MWAPSKSPWQAFGLGFGEGSHRQRSGPCGHFKVKELPGSSLRPTVPLPLTMTRVRYVTNWAQPVPRECAQACECITMCDQRDPEPDVTKEPEVGGRSG